MAPTARRVRRVGHKGADHIVPGNTLASFEAALAAGVDMIEFDVLSERPDGTGQLLLAHDYGDLAHRSAITLRQALTHFSQPRYAGIELDVDVKLPGYGQRVVEALREAGALQRALVSSTYIDDLDVMRAAEPNLRVGWSVPRVKRDYTSHALTLAPALVVLAAVRLALPARAAAAVRGGRIDAVMAHWRLVTPRLAYAVGDAGGQLYVWTVDDPALVPRLVDLGVAGIISNDPRILAAVN
jgi:glycerophosphoryl diester phosphodiesterase